MSDPIDPTDTQQPEATAAAASFYESGPGVSALDDPTPFGSENALEKLGKPPFDKKGVRGGFRLLGYLATVYEHVSQDVSRDVGKGAD